MAERSPCYVMTTYRPEERGVMSTYRLGFGFYTKLDSSDRSALGQIDPRAGGATSTGTLIAWGCNRPRPVRARRLRAGKWISSYCGDRNLRSAREAGWKIGTTSLGAGPRQSGQAIAVYVRLEDRSQYAWMCPQRLHGIYGGSLGQRIVTPTDKVFFGASYPKPAIWAKDLGNGKQVASYADIDNTDTLMANGWRELKRARAPKF